MRRGKQVLCCLSLLSLATQPASAGAKTQPHRNQLEIKYDISSYESGGKRIQIERYQPAKQGRLPVVIFVHGAAGVFTRHGSTGVPETDNFGEKEMASSGYVVLLPHYFDSTGQATVLDRDVISRQWPVWLQALKDALEYVSRMPHADTSRIALYGESLGGYLAIALAARDSRVRAVSEFAAGIPPGQALRNLPPILIQHGEDDDVVPVSEAYTLANELKRLGVPFLQKTYPGVSHYASRHTQHSLAEQTILFFEPLLRVDSRWLSFPKNDQHER
jgi:carboxymethylenebutenolidase